MKKLNKAKDYIVKQSNFKDWESVFESGKSITVETLNTGRIVCKLSGILNLKSEKASELKDGDIILPVIAHVVSHKEYGDFLIDTGFDSSFSREGGGNFKGLLKKLYFKNRYTQEEESEGVEHQIKARDINLKGVFLTHIHEHASGAPSLPNEIPYIYGMGEKEENFLGLVYSEFFKGKEDIQVIDFSQAQDMPILGKCIDIFGDGSLWAIHTPGHTKGHISYLVNGDEEKLLIIGDACSSKKVFELGIGPGLFSLDIEGAFKSFLNIREFSEKYPLVKMVFGHESDEFKVKYL